MSQTEERARLVAAAVDDIRKIEAEDGITRDSLDKIRSRLIELARRRELFTDADFPKPEPGSKANSCLYRLSEDDDHRFALYLNAAKQGAASPVHDHTTWAVIVGIEGLEENRFFERDDAERPVQVGGGNVQQGEGVALMSDDLHSIHIEGAEGAVNFHMYGLGLEQLHGRRYFKPETGEWIVFPAHSDIRDARG